MMLVFSLVRLNPSACVRSCSRARSILIRSLAQWRCSLLLGLMWAIAYLMLLHVFPDSFHGLKPGPWHENFSDAAYFSFVTLTTLGYGDILPVTPLARKCLLV